MNSQIPRKHKTQLQARMGNPDLPHLNQRHPEQHRADRWHIEWDMRPHWLVRHSQKKKTDAREAMARVAESKAQSRRKHQTITNEIEAVQKEPRKTTERTLQNQVVQVAKMDAMGCRNAEVTDLLAQRELRMESQMRDMCAQIQTTP